MSDRAEQERLKEMLMREDPTPGTLLEEVAAFPAEVRDALVREVAETFDPPPSARLLGLLTLIRTPASEQDVVAAFLANLGSPDPDARKVSLYGLEKLGHPAIADLAMQALRDPTDMVLAAACDILARRTTHTDRARALLQGVHDAHRGDPGFYQTLAILQAHGIGEGPPEDGGGGGS